MNKTLKNISAAFVLTVAFCLMALPILPASAQLNGTDLGLENAADIGLGDKPLMETISGIIQVFLGFLGILAVIIILWGGFIWMTAMGDEGKTTTAKNLIISGIIGIVIILAAYAIAAFVINTGVNVTS